MPLMPPTPTNPEITPSANAAENALIDRARNGDQNACDELFNTCYKNVFRNVRGHVSADIAEEITQAAIERVFRTLGNYKDEQHGFAAWVGKIAQRTLIDYYRTAEQQRNNMGRFNDTDIIGIASPEDVEQQVISSQMWAEIIKQLRESNKISQKELDLLLHVADGMSPQEYAELNGIEPGNARIRLHRLRKKIQDILNISDDSE